MLMTRFVLIDILDWDVWRAPIFSNLIIIEAGLFSSGFWELKFEAKILWFFLSLACVLWFLFFILRGTVMRMVPCFGGILEIQGFHWPLSSFIQSQVWDIESEESPCVFPPHFPFEIRHVLRVICSSKSMRRWVMQWWCLRSRRWQSCAVQFGSFHGNVCMFISL